MYGVASRVRRDQEATVLVLRFLLTAPDGTRATVEMRGDEIRGMLHDGDRVIVSAPSFRDGILRPVWVHNESTDSRVTAWTRPVHHRLGKPLIGASATAVISSCVTVAISRLFPEPAAKAVIGEPSSNWLEDNRVWLALVALGVLLTAAGVAFRYVRDRRHEWKEAATSVGAGLVVGALIGLVIIASDR